MDAEIDYGPLAGLIGTWKGEEGLDVAPEPDGQEENPFFETLTFEAAGTVTNAERQTLAVVRYHQVVRRKADGEVFHDQVGYWMWDAERGLVMQSVAIPRAVCLLAGGRFEITPEGATVIEVRAALDDADWGIVQSPFMREQARTVAFEHRVTVHGDRLHYRETTHLAIYGRRFEHTDESRLRRVSG
ncbi:heme-binding beta-barrel domain-containing protein [Inmirania thermothiophila]|uniref:THAP4-like heme-binding domain-containing protein n=1 Tax=Inmirania thermothiophila TaxID=1750597 RepID=A0A3N1Y434_9GAMM|nr:heme-binding beta-barrel domain-containing protein [Inmirania thermothiophila]ROR32372.1 hypothetical protein EDC57_1571 [Inmirania thermothiophila]